MAEQQFIDYYKLLQVHFDASTDIITAAYKRLVKSYHPDSDSEGSDRMALLNEAFHILSHVNSRKEYHKLWLEQNFSISSPCMENKSSTAVPVDTTEYSAREAMERFFHSLLKQEWENCYLLLSRNDQDHTLPEDFTAWRDAVELCYHLQSYQIEFVRTFTECRLDSVLYPTVVEFKVNTTELDRRTLEQVHDTVKKCAVYDGVSWRIWLGNSNIKSATLRFLMLAERNREFDPLSCYHNAASRIDPLTGLLSESGFYDDASKEATRTRRYNNPFSLLAFQLHCDSKEKETACLIQLASIIKRGLRATDLAARLSNNQIICLLTETKKASGEAAANKFLNLIREQSSESFSVSFGVVFYSGFTELKEAVLTACSIADSPAEKP